MVYELYFAEQLCLCPPVPRVVPLLAQYLPLERVSQRPVVEQHVRFWVARLRLLVVVHVRRVIALCTVTR